MNGHCDDILDGGHSETAAGGISWQPVCCCMASPTSQSLLCLAAVSSCRLLLFPSVQPGAHKKNLRGLQVHAISRPESYHASHCLAQGVCYTYDDVIFHPGHINFGAHEVRQHAMHENANPVSTPSFLHFTLSSSLYTHAAVPAGGSDHQSDQEHCATHSHRVIAHGHCDRGRNGHHHGHCTCCEQHTGTLQPRTCSPGQAARLCARLAVCL